MGDGDADGSTIQNDVYAKLYLGRRIIRRISRLKRTYLQVKSFNSSSQVGDMASTKTNVREQRASSKLRKVRGYFKGPKWWTVTALWCNLKHLSPF